MIEESIDHENDVICNTRTLLVLTIWQWKIKQFTWQLRLVVPLEFRTFYDVISMVYRSTDHIKSGLVVLIRWCF